MRALWLELREEAPLSVNACLQYFQDRYMGHWRSKILEVDLVFSYLETKGFEITVRQWGIPGRRDWYYEINREHRRFAEDRGFESFELAAEEVIRCVFLILENEVY
jgi:hypothetical protein